MRFARILASDTYGKILLVRSPEISEHHYVELAAFIKGEMKFISTEIQVDRENEAFELMEEMSLDEAESAIDRALFHPEETDNTCTMSHAGGSLH